MQKVKVEVDEVIHGIKYDERIDSDLCIVNTEEYIPMDLVKQEFQENCDVAGCTQFPQSKVKLQFDDESRILIAHENQEVCIVKDAAFEENSDPGFLDIEENECSHKNKTDEEEDVKNKICMCHMWKYRKRSISTSSENSEGFQFSKRNAMSHYNSTLQNHLSRHLNSVHLLLENKKCTLCDFRTTQESYLKRHIKAIHMHNDKSVETYCCRLYAHCKIHERFIQEHNNIQRPNLRAKKQNCKQCSYSTNRKDLFKIHIEFAHLGSV